MGSESGERFLELSRRRREAEHKITAEAVAGSPDSHPLWSGKSVAAPETRSGSGCTLRECRSKTRLQSRLPVGPEHDNGPQSAQRRSRCAASQSAGRRGKGLVSRARIFRAPASAPDAGNAPNDFQNRFCVRPITADRRVCPLGDPRELHPRADAGGHSRRNRHRSADPKRHFLANR